MKPPHLLVAISAHGYGHLSQVVPIINRLREALPQLDLTVRSDLPHAVLAERIHGSFAHQLAQDDFGLVMFDAVRVDAEASELRYQALHDDWQRRVDVCADELQASGANLVLADVPYLTLVAAKQAGIQSIALCSLNWYDIARAYLPQNEQTTQILSTMQAAYAGADAFLQPAPSMPMSWLSNRHAIGPIASPGIRQRETLLQQLGIGIHKKIILVAMGGMPLELDIREWQPTSDQLLLVPDGWPCGFPNVRRYRELGLSFQDVLANSDLVFTKSGYGTFVEAAAAGLPVLHLRRPDWPEAPFLEQWLAQRVHQQGMDADQFDLAQAVNACERLLRLGPTTPTPIDGVQQAVDIIRGYWAC